MLPAEPAAALKWLEARAEATVLPPATPVAPNWAVFVVAVTRENTTLSVSRWYSDADTPAGAAVLYFTLPLVML